MLVLFRFETRDGARAGPPIGVKRVKESILTWFELVLI